MQEFRHEFCQQKRSSHLVILRHFGASSAGTLEALHSHNKNFGITQLERLVVLGNLAQAPQERSRRDRTTDKSFGITQPERLVKLRVEVHATLKDLSGNVWGQQGKQAPLKRNLHQWQNLQQIELQSSVDVGWEQHKGWLTSGEIQEGSKPRGPLGTIFALSLLPFELSHGSGQLPEQQGRLWSQEPPACSAARLPNGLFEAPSGLPSSVGLNSSLPP
jgi:hypothetical protein